MNARLREGVTETAREGAARLFQDVLAAGFELKGLHAYAQTDGTELFRVVRLRHPQWTLLDTLSRTRLKARHRCDRKGKLIRPMHAVGGSYALGRPLPPVGGWPLYGSGNVLATNGLAIYVEGEACADAFAGLGFAAFTSAGGASNVGGSDWSTAPRGPALIWPDNDEPGAKYAKDVAAELRARGNKVEIIDVAKLGLPDKGDVVDWLALHQNAAAADVLALQTVKEGFVSFVSTSFGHSENIASSPELLPSPLPAVPTFDAAMLPESVRAWCVDAAGGLQVPLDFTAIPAMVALAGAAGRSVGIAMKQHAHWYERPMLWGCVIGRPSSGKSPALSPARRMLERLAREERTTYEVETREHQARIMVADAAKANAKKEIQVALKKKDQSGAEAAAEAAMFEDEAPSEPRIVVNDATVEKLGELLNANPRGLVQFRDELAGWLANLDREGRESDRAFWLECWNGTGAFVVDRIGRGTVRIEACAVSILGGMQPGKLAEYVRGAIRGGFSDDGLIQRFQLAVYPDLPAGWTYTDRPIDPRAEATAWAAFQRLRALDANAIGAERDPSADVPFLRFDGEAQDLFIEWYTQLMARLRGGNEAAWMESHLAKYPALVGRLALVLHLADGNAGPINADTLATALDWCGYLEGHARRIYAPAMDNGLTAAHLILKKRPDLAEAFTARDLQRRGWAGLSDRDAIEEGLELLVECGHLLAQLIEPGPRGGRRSVVYSWRAIP